MEEHLELLDGTEGDVGEYKVGGAPDARIGTQECEVVEILEPWKHARADATLSIVEGQIQIFTKRFAHYLR